MKLHINQINKKCISYVSADKFTVQPCELGDGKSFANLKNPEEIIFKIDKDGYLLEVARNPLTTVKPLTILN